MHGHCCSQKNTFTATFVIYCFNLLLHMRTECAVKVLELVLCNMSGPFDWVKRALGGLMKPIFMR